MAKNKEYHFYNDSGFDEKIEALGFKRAVKSIQSKLDLKTNQFINVEYINKRGNEIATGLINFNNEEVKAIKGLNSEEISTTLGYLTQEEVIHRNNLVLS